MASIGCSTKLLHFIKFLTHQQNIFTEINLDHPKYCYKGVPQEGVLNPLFYLLYVANAIKVTHPLVKILQYADDTVMCIRTPNVKEGKQILEDSVAEVTDNLSDSALDVSPEKTELVHFNREGIEPDQTEIMVKGRTISSIDSVTFLGIRFDYQLKFDKHMSHMLQKSNKTLNIVKFIRETY